MQGIEPLESWPGSAKPWRCKCLRCGEAIEVVWSSIYRDEHRACPYCSGIRVREDDVVDLMRRVGLVEPLEPYVNARRKWKSRCLRCEGIVYPTYSNVLSGFGACSSCAVHGFRVDDPAVVYLLHNAGAGVGKYGITNTTGVRGGMFRLNHFFNRGFDPVSVYEFPNGAVSREVESSLMAWVRVDLGLPSMDRTQFGNGATEMFPLGDLRIARFKSRLTRLAKKNQGTPFERFTRTR